MEALRARELPTCAEVVRLVSEGINDSPEELGWTEAQGAKHLPNVPDLQVLATPKELREIAA